jgi:hypothetical protein
VDFIRFLRQHRLDDRVDGHGIHIYYSTPNNIDNALSICGGAERKPCWPTEWGGFPTKGTSYPLGYGSGDDLAHSISSRKPGRRAGLREPKAVGQRHVLFLELRRRHLHPACNSVTRSGKLAIAPLE